MLSAKRSSAAFEKTCQSWPIAKEAGRPSIATEAMVIFGNFHILRVKCTGVARLVSMQLLSERQSSTGRALMSNNAFQRSSTIVAALCALESCARARAEGASVAPAELGR